MQSAIAQSVNWRKAIILSLLALALGLSCASAAPFSVNATRFDPYKNFKFRVKWDGHYVAGISKVGPLVRRTDVVEFREGGAASAARKSPGRTEFEPVTLERGVTHDTAFEDWADKVFTLGAGLGSEMALAGYRKDVRIEFLNEAGQLALAYDLQRCWVSEYQAVPELDANVSDVAIERITLQCEGWERDKSVPEPTEQN